jgi:hypothetical protein
MLRSQFVKVFGDSVSPDVQPVSSIPHTPAGVRQATCDDWLRAVRVAGVRGVKDKTDIAPVLQIVMKQDHSGRIFIARKVPFISTN